MLDAAAILPLSSQLKNLYGSACRSVCLEFDLTQTEFDILDFLSSDTGYDTAAEISKRRFIKKANVSTSTDKLINKGLIIRCPDPRDKRMVHLKLTEKASLPVSRIKEAKQKLWESFSLCLTKDELETLINLISKLTSSYELCYGSP